MMLKKCTLPHNKSVFCVKKEKKIASIYSSNAPLPTQYENPGV